MKHLRYSGTMVAASDNIASACPTVLVTGFEPFGADSLNPSWMAAQALHGRMVARHRLIGAQLPTVFGRAIATLRELLLRHRPVLVVGTGQAGGQGPLAMPLDQLVAGLKVAIECAISTQEDIRQQAGALN